MSTFALVFVIIGAVFGIANAVLHVVAPRTRTTVDDDLVVLLDKAKEMDLIGHVKQVIIDALAAAQTSAKASMASAQHQPTDRS